MNTLTLDFPGINVATLVDHDYGDCMSSIQKLYQPCRLTSVDCIDCGPVIFPQTTLQIVKVQLTPVGDA
jgi:hypothetical protein